MADVAARLVEAFSQKELTFGTAESLTGGMIASDVASVSGASAVLMGGIVAYDPAVKRNVLGVEQTVIDEDGVVSAKCALQMAQGARALLGVDVAVSATGLAGPSGGTEKTPVGTVFIGCAGPKESRVDECHFEGNRQQVRRQAAQHALKMALQAAGEPILD